MEVVLYFRCTVLEDIFQGFQLVYRTVHGLFHQFICHEFISCTIIIIIITLWWIRSRIGSVTLIKSFFLNLFAAELYHTEQVFIPEHITGSIISIAFLPEGKASTHNFLQCVQPSLLGGTAETVFLAALKLKHEIGFHLPASCSPHPLLQAAFS